MKIYIDWKNKKIYSPEEYDIVISELKERENLTFENFLNQFYSKTEIFNMSEQDKRDTKEEFVEWLEDEIEYTYEISEYNFEGVIK